MVHRRWALVGAVLALASACGQPRSPGAQPPVTRPGPPITQPPLTEPPWEPKWPPLQTSVEHFELSFDDAAAAIVYDLSKGTVWVDGTFKARGVEYAVQLRQRGQAARYAPKHSWKVELPAGVRLDGMRRLNFLAEYPDSGYLSDMLSFSLMNAAGVPAAMPRFAKLTVNGEYQGLYVVLDNIDKAFLEARGLDPHGSVYRCGSRDCEMTVSPVAWYQKPWTKRTNEAEPFDELYDFLRALNRTPEHELAAWLEQNLDLDAYVRQLAALALVAAHGVDDSGSFLVRDYARRQWIYSPWDLNNSAMIYFRTLPSDAEPIVDTPLAIFTAYDEEQVSTYEWKEQKYGGAHLPFSNLNQRVWDNPALRARVLEAVEKLLDTVFSPAQADARIDAWYALIRDELPKDPWVNLANARHAPDYLKQYVAGRGAFARTQLPLERARGLGGVVINAIGAAGGTRRDGAGEADAWIELYNREERPFALGGATITDDLRSASPYRLPSGLTVPAKGTLTLWADGQPQQGATHLPFTLGADGGELGLYDGQSPIGVLDLTFYAPLGAGREYGRVPDGAETWAWRR